MSKKINIMNERSQEKSWHFKKKKVYESQKYQSMKQAKYIRKSKICFAAIKGGDKVFSRGLHLHSWKLNQKPFVCCVLASNRHERALLITSLPLSRHFSVLHLPLNQWTLIWGSWSIALNSTEPSYIWSFQRAMVVWLWTSRQRVHDRLECYSCSSNFVPCCSVAGFTQKRTGNLY